MLLKLWSCFKLIGPTCILKAFVSISYEQCVWFPYTFRAKYANHLYSDSLHPVRLSIFFCQRNIHRKYVTWRAIYIRLPSVDELAKSEAIWRTSTAVCPSIWARWNSKDETSSDRQTDRRGGWIASRRLGSFLIGCRLLLSAVVIVMRRSFGANSRVVSTLLPFPAQTMSAFYIGFTCSWC